MFCPKCGNPNENTNAFCKKCGQPLPDASQVRQAAPTGLVGHVLDGKYRIEAKLGAGGMGDVYQATRLLIGDTVAIKILHPHLAVDPQAAERFRREAVTATKLRHRNVVTIFDVGIAADYKVPYILMELAEGFSLRQIINEYKVLPLDFAVTVTAQVCAALDEAHRLGIIHRDIKPENIIANQTDRGWQIKILDFGIAKLYDQGDIGLTQDGSAMGTPQYMSPEQCMGETLDARSDIYSVGIVLYELLCGTVPFKSPSPSAVAIFQVQNAPALPHTLNPDIHPQVEEVILKSLAKQPGERQRAASQLAQELIQAATAAFRSGYTAVSSTPIPTPAVTPDFVPVEVGHDDVTEPVVELPIETPVSEVTEVLPTVVLADAIEPGLRPIHEHRADITATDQPSPVLTPSREVPDAAAKPSQILPQTAVPDLPSAAVPVQKGDAATEIIPAAVIAGAVELAPPPADEDAKGQAGAEVFNSPADVEAAAIPAPDTELPSVNQIDITSAPKKTMVGRKRKTPPAVGTQSARDVTQEVPLVVALGEKRLAELPTDAEPAVEPSLEPEPSLVEAEQPIAEASDGLVTAEEVASVVDIAPPLVESKVLTSTREPLADASSPDMPKVPDMRAEAAPPIFSEQAGAGGDRRLLLIIGGIILLGVVALVGAGSLYFFADSSDESVAQDAQAKPEAAPPVPPGMVHVPGGEFTMGSNQGDQYSRPEHKATVGAFFMDVTEVTNEDYQEFVAATGHKPPPDWKGGTPPDGKARFPVTGVDWNDADAFAKWKGKRLPTEEEWEFAARGTDGRLYPWGNDWKDGNANADGRSRGMQEVKKALGTSQVGLYDMSGNAWEWTSSDAEPYAGGKPFKRSALQRKIIRGGCWASKRQEATVSNRAAWGITGEPDGYADSGFRCVKDL